MREFHPKHVKGHDKKSKTARSWVNKQCDSLARETWPHGVERSGGLSAFRDEADDPAFLPSGSAHLDHRRHLGVGQAA